jgi:long-subunit acyl-CoA synthetase (AMP-forming)
MRRLFEALARHARDAGERVAMSDGRITLSRSQALSRIAGLAGELLARGRVIGLLAPNGVEWAIAQLACAVAGKIVVPLPRFFSPAQLGHIVRDASVDLILVTQETEAQGAQLGARILGLDATANGASLPELAEGFGEISYTSGSTGQPKGVRLESGQIAWSAAALADATQAVAGDCYLSILPLPLLIETICAVFVPALVGASVHFDRQQSDIVAGGGTFGLAASFDTHRPTMSVLVPQLLKDWTEELIAARKQAPDSLRFVAVGGAPVPAQLAEKAWSLGVPVHEGYGLTECCSVVSVNRPGQRRSGSAGRPLGGLRVSIDAGEIVVDGPSLTDGYLRSAPGQRPWRSGDLGEIDEDGYLTVHGRKDSRIVTAFGRNVSPEWIETMLLGDARIAACAVVGHGEPDLRALLIPSRKGGAWFDAASRSEFEELIRACCSEAPAYAVPRSCVVVSFGEAVAAGLLTKNGRVRREEVAKFMRVKAHPQPAIPLS